MKVAPVYAELERRGNVEQHLIHTGQHFDALLKDVFFAELPLPRPHLELHTGSGSHAEQTGRALIELEGVFLGLQPDLVVVAGDVNSTLAGALAAVKVGVPVCHIESGLRSFDWEMPEEHNRRVADHLSKLLLTHCEDANKWLDDEGIPNQHQAVQFVGNTMIDTLRTNEDAARGLEAWHEYGVRPGDYLLVTLHRPSLVDVPEVLARTIAALDDVARSLPVLFPVHPRTQRALEASGLATDTKVVLIPPLPYRAFLSLESEAAAVVTDSGGIQEETTALGVPCFTLRDNTERPVTIEVGTNTLLGLEPDMLRQIPPRLATPKRGQIPPLWDGRAGERAADEVERLLTPQEVHV
jgi:UDP-N-acetylglucosamine 2-epimerase (non-hydrolysing)